MTITFEGMTYPTWESDYKRLTLCKEFKSDDVREYCVSYTIGIMKRSQQLFAGDRSHPEIVELDSMLLSYEGWEEDVKTAEVLHVGGKRDYLRHELSDPFASFIKRMREKQAEYNAKEKANDSKVPSKSTPASTTSKTDDEMQQSNTTKTKESEETEDINEQEDDEDISEQEEEDDDNVCVICMEHRRNHVFEGCGHVLLCAECAWAPGLHCQPELRCPLCRMPSSKIIKAQ
jgi:hypothetical protein